MKDFSVLWRLVGFGKEVHLAGRKYWWRNRGRPFREVAMQYTLAGTLRFVQNGKETPVPQKHAFFFDHEDSTEYGLAPGDGSYTCLWVTFRGAGLVEHWDIIRERFGSVIFDDSGRLLELLWDIIKRGSPSDQQDGLVASAAVHQFVMNLLLLLDHHKGRTEKPVDQVISLLRANPIYPWSLKELVAKVGCSREHVSRIFRQRYDQSPAAWLNEQRLAHAVNLLRTTALTVETIAQQSGFSGAHGLARLLRHRYGFGPRDLRQNRKV